VVLGNPPYSGHSANRSRDEKGELTFIGHLIETYKEGCPELHKPAQAKWLQDDYVKFIRFAQWRVDRTGDGILAFITNHGYLDNPTFRGMRRSLMQSFNEIHVYDLHGSSKKKEEAPDGSKDENVFDIQQGVAILLAVKNGNHANSTVYHADLWGPREHKYDVLSKFSMEDTKWEKLAPSEPRYLFVPEDSALRTEYERGWSVPEIFGENGDPAPGIVTTHDEFAIAFTEAEIRSNVQALLRTETEEEARELFQLCTQNQWKYHDAMQALANADWPKQITRILYRPFDFRWTVFNRYVAVHRRERVMKHMLAGSNIGLITTRLTKDKWDCFVTDTVMGHKALAAYDINYLFPLFIYGSSPDKDENHELFSNERRDNLSPKFLEAFARHVGVKQEPTSKLPVGVTADEIMEYAYAVFHSPGYRTRYAEFLKREFPRLPIAGSLSLFRKLAAMGRKLIDLHLMRAAGLDELVTEFPVKGNNTVAKVSFTPEDNRVWINATQYFAGTPREAWEYYVGGFQVCDKWLKDRKGRELTYDDVQHWQRIVVALVETMRLTREIDALIPKWPLK
jgi:predicted helicase